MPLLVLLPGLDGTGELFEPFLRELPAGLRTQVLSYPADARLGYDELTRFVESVLPPELPLVLLGESFSGPIAIRLAASLGARVQGLVLCCSFARSPRAALPRLAGLIHWLPSPARLPASLSAWMLLGGEAPAESRMLLERVLVRLSAEVTRARLRAIAAVNVERELAAVRAPVLYLQAGHDRLVPPSAVDGMRRVQPGIDVIRLPGGHGLLQAAPATAAAEVAAFLARASRAEDMPFVGRG